MKRFYLLLFKLILVFLWGVFIFSTVIDSTLLIFQTSWDWSYLIKAVQADHNLFTEWYTYLFLLVIPGTIILIFNILNLKWKNLWYIPVGLILISFLFLLCILSRQWLLCVLTPIVMIALSYIIYLIYGFIHHSFTRDLNRWLFSPFLLPEVFRNDNVIVTTDLNKNRVVIREDLIEYVGELKYEQDVAETAEYIRMVPEFNNSAVDLLPNAAGPRNIPESLVSEVAETTSKPTPADEEPLDTIETEEASSSKHNDESAESDFVNLAADAKPSILARAKEFFAGLFVKHDEQVTEPATDTIESEEKEETAAVASPKVEEQVASELVKSTIDAKPSILARAKEFFAGLFGKHGEQLEEETEEEVNFENDGTVVDEIALAAAITRNTVSSHEHAEESVDYTISAANKPVAEEISSDKQSSDEVTIEMEPVAAPVVEHEDNTFSMEPNKPATPSESIFTKIKEKVLGLFASKSSDSDSTIVDTEAIDDSAIVQSIESKEVERKQQEEPEQDTSYVKNMNAQYDQQDEMPKTKPFFAKIKDKLMSYFKRAEDEAIDIGLGQQTGISSTSVFEDNPIVEGTPTHERVDEEVVMSEDQQPLFQQAEEIYPKEEPIQTTFEPTPEVSAEPVNSDETVVAPIADEQKELDKTLESMQESLPEEPKKSFGEKIKEMFHHEKEEPSVQAAEVSAEPVNSDEAAVAPVVDEQKELDKSLDPIQETLPEEPKKSFGEKIKEMFHHEKEEDPHAEEVVASKEEQPIAQAVEVSAEPVVADEAVVAPVVDEQKELDKSLEPIQETLPEEPKKSFGEKIKEMFHHEKHDEPQIEDILPDRNDEQLVQAPEAAAEPVADEAVVAPVVDEQKELDKSLEPIQETLPEEPKKSFGEKIKEMFHHEEGETPEVLAEQDPHDEINDANISKLPKSIIKTIEEAEMRPEFEFINPNQFNPEVTQLPEPAVVIAKEEVVVQVKKPKENHVPHVVSTPVIQQPHVPHRQKEEEELNIAVIPSRDMAHILGTTDPMPKWQAVSLVWDYIHNNHLQDAQDPRKIYPDSAVLNITPVECRDNKYITMSDLTDYINKHLAPNDGTKVGGKF